MPELLVTDTKVRILLWIGNLTSKYVRNLRIHQLRQILRVSGGSDLQEVVGLNPSTG